MGVGGEVLSGVVGRGGGGSVDGSGGIVVTNEGLVLVGVSDVRRSGGEVLGGVVGRGGGGSVDGSSGVVVANEEPLVGEGVMDDAVGVSDGGGGVGSGGSGGRSSGWGSVRSQSSVGEGGDEIVGRGGLVLLDKGHEGCCKGWVGVEDSVEESGGVGGGKEIVGHGVNSGGDVSGHGSVGGCGGVGDGIDVMIGSARRKWGSIGGDVVGGDGVYLLVVWAATVVVSAMLLNLAGS